MGDVLTPEVVVILAICSIRPLVAVAMIPAFAPAYVPESARNAFVVAMVAPVAWLQFEHGATLINPSWLDIFMIVLRETAIGLLIGLGFAAFFAGFHAVGEIIDHQSGLTFAQNIDPVNGNQVSVTADLLGKILTVALIAGGALLVVIQTIYLSFEIFPIGRPLGEFGSFVPLRVMESSGRLFAFALLLAGPVIFVLLVVEIAFGMLNRAAPQLNVYNITLTMKSMVGLAIVGLSLPLLIDRVLVGFFELARMLQRLVSG